MLSTLSSLASWLRNTLSRDFPVPPVFPLIIALVALGLTLAPEFDIDIEPSRKLTWTAGVLGVVGVFLSVREVVGEKPTEAKKRLALFSWLIFVVVWLLLLISLYHT